MRARAIAAEPTRRRIVQSAMTLHAEQGVLATSYEQTARRAGTAPAAVYRHFSTLADPLPACARSTHVLQPVTPALVADIFRGLDRPSSRMEVLVRGTCECYERDGAWLRAARYEEHLVEPLEELARVQRANLALLVRAALTGTKASERATRVMAALSDFPVWEKLRVAGLNAAEATEQVLELVRDQLGKENTP
ncbi:HTH-type transcriptional regulator BetI [bacterium HR29]|jgi:AcrR family transcriptional regulator|nr:HTH-type transcriptional regulator BetI [bacterium HR29]